MRSVFLILCFLYRGGFAQFPSGSAPWGQGGPPASRPPFGKPSRQSSYSRPVIPYGKPPSGPGSGPQLASDDPIPANPHLDSSYETQQLPAKLPILAPNGVVEIYNRVVDDLIKRLEVSFKKREIDPMSVLIRPTPTGPVRVPGHLQKRPFRRPGAALYRSNIPMTPVRMKTARANSLPEESDQPIPPPIDGGAEKPSFRGAGKISKGPLENKPEVSIETTPSTVVGIPSVAAVEEVSSTSIAPVVTTNEKSIEEPSSEELNLFRARTSDEYFADDDDIEVEGKGTRDTKSRTASPKKSKKEKKKEESDEDDEDPRVTEEGKQDVDTLIQRYQNKNVNENKSKSKYSTNGGKKKEEGGNSTGGSKKKPETEKEAEELVEEDEDDEDIQDDMDNVGPNPIGNRQENFYPPQLKPNAQLTGLSKIKRASDVVVSVDARSAVITARLLVGPLNVNINDSTEPMEKNVRAIIPELEAELILMERHGVVFLQRFTLDRAYGQDVEISIPKSKAVDANKKKKGNAKTGIQGQHGGAPGMDPNHPMNAVVQQRFQTKMAAHISMEVVKLLRSGNLRVNMMRTAQGSMSKLKLPIKANKTAKKKTVKKSEKKNKENI